MTYFLTSKFRSIPVLAGSGSGAPRFSREASSSQKTDLAGNTYMKVSANTVVSTTSEPVIASTRENQIVRTTLLSSAAFTPWATISHGYQKLGKVLEEMRNIDSADEEKIHGPVIKNACDLANGLLAKQYPAPKVFNHGPASVVFNWTRGNRSLYLTVSEKYVSALLSTPEKIQKRINLSTESLLDPATVVRGLLPSPTEQLVTRNSSSQVPDITE
jgi:hypothetical protein